MTQDFSIPKFCPLQCGETLLAVRISGRALELAKKRPDANQINFDESYGILCKSCGYASQIMVYKK